MTRRTMLVAGLAVLAVFFASVAVVQTVRFGDEHRRARDARSAFARSEAQRTAAVEELEKRQMLDAARNGFPDGTFLSGSATPVIEPPAGVPLCRADDLEVANPDPGFLRLFNRSGHTCALLDYPALVGVAEGKLAAVLMYETTEPGYTDGPRWSGVFDPKLTAVLSIRTPRPDSSGQCATGLADSLRFTDLKLVLAGTTSALQLGTASLEVGPCRPTVSTFAYDSTDQ